MSAGIEGPPKELWVLFDIDNGDHPHKNYYWWFTSKRDAVRHKRRQAKVPLNAELIGPFKYKLDKAQ